MQVLREACGLHSGHKELNAAFVRHEWYQATFVLLGRTFQ